MQLERACRIDVDKAICHLFVTLQIRTVCYHEIPARRDTSISQPIPNHTRTATKRELTGASLQNAYRLSNIRVLRVIYTAHDSGGGGASEDPEGGLSGRHEHKSYDVLPIVRPHLTRFWELILDT